MRLEKLIITNFAGIDHLEIHPGDDLTISGPNGSRKSTIANAYAWCLTGKDMKSTAWILSACTVLPMSNSKTVKHTVSLYVPGVWAKMLTTS